MMLIILIVAFNIAFFSKGALGRTSNDDTVQFIEKWLKNDDGALATYMKETVEADEDKVQGREALSESLGLWMLYTVESDDKERFEESFRILSEAFMSKDGFITWKLPENGSAREDTNALVDDLRIYKALVSAHRKWKEPEYQTTADKIGAFLGDHLIFQSVMVDFYDRFYDYQTKSITLSYLDPEAIELLNENGHLTSFSYEKILGVLHNMPMHNGFYPKTYHIDKNRMVYDEEINMIDQLLVAINRSQLGYGSEELMEFINQQLSERGVLNGRYSMETKEAMVDYESPAIYGFVILQAIHSEEKELATKAYKRMVEFRVTRSKYKGAYSINEKQNTHIFDNLVPLLAIERLKNIGWVQE